MRIEPRRALAGVLLAAVSLATGSLASAQQHATSAECSAKLSAASPDSQVLQVGIVVESFDRAQPIPVNRQALIGEGIRQFTTLPKVMPLDVYSPLNKEAALTVHGTYRTTLRRDGHFTHVRSVGGTQTRGLDEAMVAAIVALDTSGLLPPPDSAMLGAADSIELRITVAPTSVWPTTLKGKTPTTRAGVTPLVLLRVPIRGASGPPFPRPENPRPRYPESLRNAGITGEATFRFVVDASGAIDMQTVQVVSATALPFAASGVEVLPKLRFDPLLVEGCPVASLAIMPFGFSIR